MTLALRFIPDIKEEVRRPFDVPGFMATAIAMVSLVYAMELMGAQQFAPGLPLTLLLLGGITWRIHCVIFSKPHIR